MQATPLRGVAARGLSRESPHASRAFLGPLVPFEGLGVAHARCEIMGGGRLLRLGLEAAKIREWIGHGASRKRRWKHCHRNRRRGSVLIYIRDPWTIDAQPLEFPSALILALEPPLCLHDHGPWLEWAPAAVEGSRRIYDLGRHLLEGHDVCVKADGLILVEFALLEDENGWHLTINGSGGVRNAPLPDFDPSESTGLQASVGELN